MRTTFTEWIEAFQAKPWYRPLVLLAMIVIAIDLWSDRGPILGLLGVVFYVGVVGTGWFPTNANRFHSAVLLFMLGWLGLALLTSWALWVCAAIAAGFTAALDARPHRRYAS